MRRIVPRLQHDVTFRRRLGEQVVGGDRQRPLGKIGEAGANHLDSPDAAEIGDGGGERGSSLGDAKRRHYLIRAGIVRPDAIERGHRPIPRRLHAVGEQITGECDIADGTMGEEGAVSEYRRQH